MFIHVKVKVDCSKESLVKVSEDHFEISVKEPAKNNLANKRIIAILKNIFTGQNVRIINGHHSNSKLISIGFDE